MTEAEAVEAALRAGNAAGRFTKDGLFAAINAGGRQAGAVWFVRHQAGASAEALYLHVRRDPAVGWRDLEARKRVAVEVFRATLLICDRLVAPTPAIVVAPPVLESAITRLPQLGERIWDEPS